MACNRGHGSVRVTVTPLMLLLGLVVVLSLASQSCHGGTFGFDIHHRLSDPVKGILGIDDELPRKGSPQYYAAMVHRDRVFRGRRLAADHYTLLTFAAGNETYQIDASG